MIYNAFFQHPDWKKKRKEKKKDQPTDPPNFQAKRANKPLFFRPNNNVQQRSLAVWYPTSLNFHFYL